MDVGERNKKNVATLRTYLTHLPRSLPEPPVPSPDLRRFTPKPGVLPGDSAVDEALRDALGSDGSFTIRERGAGIEALADVLERYLAQYPMSLPLLQWLYMALIAVENAYRVSNTPLVSFYKFIFLSNIELTNAASC